MPAPIDFYFDFSSPYGYLAAELIDAIGERHGRAVMWHPMLLGVAFRAMGQAPLAQVPLKGAYALHDFARSARFHGLPYRHPEVFPVSTQHAARAFLWAQDHQPVPARRLARALFRAYFVEGRRITEPEDVLDLAAGVGFERDTLAAVLAGSAIKERLKAEVELALARGVFGSPFFIVDGEPFWGVDRLPQLERWLDGGAF